MTTQFVWGLLLPFMGTVLGAGGVFFLRRQLRRSVQRVLAGFAAGAFSVKLTEEDIAFLEEPYVPHRIVGAVDSNPPEGTKLLDVKK